MCGQGVLQASAVIAAGQDSDGEHERYIEGGDKGLARGRMGGYRLMLVYGDLWVGVIAILKRVYS